MTVFFKNIFSNHTNIRCLSNTFSSSQGEEIWVAHIVGLIAPNSLDIFSYCLYIHDFKKIEFQLHQWTVSPILMEDKFSVTIEMRCNEEGRSVKLMVWISKVKSGYHWNNSADHFFKCIIWQGWNFGDSYIWVCVVILPFTNCEIREQFNLC